MRWVGPLDAVRWDRKKPEIELSIARVTSIARLREWRIAHVILALLERAIAEDWNFA